MPLDLSQALAACGDHKQLSIRIENVPQGGSLSTGRNNGDRTWSLKPEELHSLAYLPPEGDFEPHVLSVRVLGIDGESAVAVALLEIPISPAVMPPAQPAYNGAAADIAPGPYSADYAAFVQDPLAGAAGAVNGYQTPPLAQFAPPAPPIQHEQIAALSEHLAAAEARAANAEYSVSEMSARLAQAMARAEQAEAAVTAARTQAASEFDSRLRVLGEELAAAKAALSSYEATIQARCGEVEANLKDEHARELAQARQAQARELEQVARTAEQRLQQIHTASLAQARAEWERELGTNVADARARAEEEVRARLEDARGGLETEVQRRVADAAEAWRDGERDRLAAARAEWEDHARRAKTRGLAARAKWAKRRAILRRGVVRAAWLAAWVTAGVYLYPHVAPKVVELWGPEFVKAKAKLASFRF